MKMVSSCLVIGLAFVVTDVGREIVQEFSWNKLAMEGKLITGEVRETIDAPGGVLIVRGKEGQKTTSTILRIASPNIQKNSYALTGRVKYEGVEETGYLEMWNHFTTGQYFSRALSPDAGPMQHLQGSSGWRAFVIPFHNKPDSPPPDVLVLNVVLPGVGEVHLTSPKLIHLGGLGAHAWPLRIDTASGVILGILGALVGTLGSTGKAKHLVVTCVVFMFVIGVLQLGLGIMSILQHQPRLLMVSHFGIGLVGIVVSLLVIGPVKKRYAALELRRMQAVDAR